MLVIQGTPLCFDDVEGRGGRFALSETRQVPVNRQARRSADARFEVNRAVDRTRTRAILTRDFGTDPPQPGPGVGSDFGSDVVAAWEAAAVPAFFTMEHDFCGTDVDSYPPGSSITVMNADEQRVLQAGERALVGTMVDLTDDKRSRQELTEALAFRDRVMGILGHDLRNPLSAITALARATMGHQDLPEVVHERLVQIDRAAQRSLAMIGTLLDFSESRFRGALSTRAVPCEPAVIAGRVIDELRVTHPDRPIILRVSGHDSFHLDPVRMEQVLANLVSNALVHGSHEAPVEVAVDVRDAEMKIVVKNRGPVIPPQQIGLLFEPFVQGSQDHPSDDQDDRPRGLGLGLYIVRQIVAAHAGTISVESDAISGTSFVVCVPRPHPV